MEQPVLQLKGIIKSFHGERVLDNACLNVYQGKAMALLGENGAGKSTLVKVMAGVYAMDEGSFFFKGKKVCFTHPSQSIQQGISVIHQELSLIPELSVAENIFLGREPVKRFGRIDWKSMNDQASKLLKMLSVSVEPTARVRAISIGLQQMVEIARGLAFNAEVIVMDEPSDVLSPSETDSLFRIIQRLKSEGKAVVYISHRLSDVFRICDDVTILRNGSCVSESVVTSMTDEQLVELIAGRKIKSVYPGSHSGTGFMASSSSLKPRSFEDNHVSLSAKGLVAPEVNNVCFELYRGEVLSFFGLDGAGRTALLKILCGASPIISGQVKIAGTKVDFKSPEDALAHGVVYVSKDRKNEGLVADLSVQDNMSLSCLKQFSFIAGTIKSGLEQKVVRQFLHRLDIKLSSMDQPVRDLSGGNQQKVAIAKALMTNPDVLILDEPTRGIDACSKQEIYSLINELRKNGVSIILGSSDISETLGMSDRLLVINEGRIVCEHITERTSEKTLLSCAMGDACDDSQAA